MAATYITKTNGGTGSETKGTFSAWIKILGLGDDNTIFHEYESSGNYISIKLKSGAIQVYGQNNSSAFVNVKTTRVLKDIASWYNIVVAFDSTQSTASNRVKIYINGVQETTLSSTTYPGSSANCKINQNNEQQTIGGARNAEYFIGLMSHVHWVDGTAYSGSDFGSTDATTGEWLINTSPTLTYGTNGFFILKDGNTITDSSPNSNNFSLGGGTLTKTEDCPSNVFATLNPLSPPASGLDIRNGNTHVFNDDESNVWQTVPATLAISPTAKIYWEIKCVGVWGSASCQMHGITDLDNTIQALTGQASDNATSFAWRNDASFRTNGSTISGTTWATSYTTNDFLMFALDNANGALYAGKNGTWLNSGNPTSGASKTGALSVTAGLNYAPHSELKYGSDKPAYNFGNGYYVTTAVSSAGTTASTPGIFEYDVPTGYQPLSTKGLNA